MTSDDDPAALPTGRLDPRLWEPIDNPAAQVVADLESQGIDLVGLRVLQVVCEHNKNIAEVLKCERRLILRYAFVESNHEVPMTDRDRESASVILERYGVRIRERLVKRIGAEVHTAYLDELGGTGIKAANRCCIQRIPLAWLRSALKEGRKRKVFAATKPTTLPYSRLDIC